MSVPTCCSLPHSADKAEGAEHRLEDCGVELGKVGWRADQHDDIAMPKVVAAEDGHAVLHVVARHGEFPACPLLAADARGCVGAGHLIICDALLTAIGELGINNLIVAGGGEGVSLFDTQHGDPVSLSKGV